MATTKEYKDYVLEKLSILDDITCRPMMGEYLLYYHGTLFGGIYDNRLLVKMVDSNKKYYMKREIPYQNAKEMYHLEEMENREILKSIIEDTCKGLQWNIVKHWKQKV